MTENGIGYTIYFSASLPATNDATGFEALTWTEATGMQEAPQFGITHANIDIPDLTSGFTKGVKGAASGTESSIPFREVDSDTGQALAKTIAEDEDGICSVKLAKGSGASGAVTTGDPVEYAQGYLKDYQWNKPTTTSHEGFSVAFKQNDFSVIATEPA